MQRGNANEVSPPNRMRCIDGVLPPVHVEDFLGVTIAPESHSESYKRSLYRHWIDEVGDKLGTPSRRGPGIRGSSEFLR